MPMVLDSFSSTSSFAASVQLLPIDLLPDRRHHSSLFVVSPSPLAFLVSPSVPSFLPPSSLFLLSTPPVVVPLPPGALPLLPLFVL